MEAHKPVPTNSGGPIINLGGRRITARPAPSAASAKVDEAIVFDTTGSMRNKIDGLVQCMDGQVHELGNLGLDWTFTTVPFGDLTIPGDRTVGEQPFVTTVEAATRQLRTMPRFWGGGNLGESSGEALLAACKKQFRPEAVKVLILITDEPALGGEQIHQAVEHALDQLDAVCFTVAPPLPYFQRWAQRHGGEWRAVSDTVDTSAMMALFRSLLTKVAVTAEAVHRLGGGSVRAYLERGGS